MSNPDMALELAYQRLDALEDAIRKALARHDEPYACDAYMTCCACGNDMRRILEDGIKKAAD